LREINIAITTSLFEEELFDKTFYQLRVGALVISAFGLMEAVAIAKQLAIRAGDRWDPNQELIGQGLGD